MYYNFVADVVKESLEFLMRDDYKNGNTTFEHWKKTFHYREIKIRMNGVNQTLLEWPHFIAADGHILV